ncbi:MAG: methionyl-tRNA formyltransferase [Parcubacteria group bacterium]|nr:methionyl-tRNA formyltransferase [Parcubacteria group bacterium]
MTSSPVGIVFFGSSRFGVPALMRLLGQPSDYEVMLVISQPDKLRQGRLWRPQPTPLKIAALEAKVPVVTPSEIMSEEFINILKRKEPELLIVAAYGKIIPKALLDIPPRGALNLHGSLLPKYRGASPIQAAILAGDAVTGVTIMEMDAKLDHGPVIGKVEVPIQPDDTTATLEPRLADAGSELLLRVLPEYVAGRIKPVPQNHKDATITRVISKAEGRIAWDKGAVEIERMIRAFTPWPTAYTFWKGKQLILHRAWVGTIPVSIPLPLRTPGRVVRDENQATGVIAGGDSLLILDEVQLAGKNRMAIQDFLRGAPDVLGNILG